MNRIPLLFAGAVAVVLTGLVLWRGTRPTPSPIPPSVLGQASLPGQTHFDALTTVTNTPMPISPTLTPTPTPEAPTVTVVDGPRELAPGDIATFTWHVGGAPASIRTTALYYGTTSHPGVFLTDAKPQDTRYNQVLKDFLDGTYGIPLRFVGSAAVGTPGTYYYRSYALVGGKHYWSGERTFTVKALPKHEIKLLHFPSIVSAGENAAFTWDVSGPAATTGFTAIVGGKLSKPGALDAAVDIPQTPYAILTQDFVYGNYAVPLRFIGNAKIPEAGVYYFRALVFINGKNIWSDEYSFTVQ